MPLPLHWHCSSPPGCARCIGPDAASPWVRCDDQVAPPPPSPTPAPSSARLLQPPPRRSGLPLCGSGVGGNFIGVVGPAPSPPPMFSSPDFADVAPFTFRHCGRGGPPLAVVGLLGLVGPGPPLWLGLGFGAALPFFGSRACFGRRRCSPGYPPSPSLSTSPLRWCSWLRRPPPLTSLSCGQVRGLLRRRCRRIGVDAQPQFRSSPSRCYGRTWWCCP